MTLQGGKYQFDGDAVFALAGDVYKRQTLTFAIGSGLAAVAALMYCSTYPRVTTDMGSMMGMKAFIAAVLGHWHHPRRHDRRHSGRPD